MGEVIILNTKEKVMGLKVGDRVRFHPNEREFVVHQHNPVHTGRLNQTDQIWFHGGQSDGYKRGGIFYVRNKDGSNCGHAVWTREGLWEAIRNGTYYISL